MKQVSVHFSNLDAGTLMYHLKCGEQYSHAWNADRVSQTVKHTVMLVFFFTRPNDCHKAVLTYSC